MVNLEKLTGRIISDAEEYGRQLLEASRHDIDEIKDAAASKAAYIKADYASRAAKEAEGIKSRAEASSDSESRAVLLAAKTGLLDRAFGEAYKKLLQIAADPNNRNEYTAFLSRLLVSVITGAADEENAHREYYTSGELISHRGYSVLFCARDAGAVSDAVIAGASKSLPKGISVTSDGRNADIDGGFILRSGDIEYNCSLETLAAQYRAAHEGEVYKLLFG